MGKKIKLTEKDLTRIIERIVKEQEDSMSGMEFDASLARINVELTDGSLGTITIDELDRIATEAGYKK